jgi:hypothetical protein
VGEGDGSCFPFSANMNAGAKAGFEYRRLGIMPESAECRAWIRWIREEWVSDT